MFQRAFYIISKCVSLVLVTLIFTSAAFAESIPALLASPQEKFLGGIFYSGAFAVNHLPECNPQAVLRIVGPKLWTEESRIQFSSGRNSNVGHYNKSLAFDLNQALNHLIKAGDKELVRRHVCVGAYDYGQVVNAISYSAGFILYDPKLVVYMNEELPGRSMYSLRQVMFHELAHQFQFWFGSRFSADSSDRRGELVADCVGAALAGLELEGLSDDLYRISSEGVVRAVASLGDFEVNSRSHHGTPVEREKAARSGLQMIRTQSTFMRLSNTLTAKSILQKCESNWINK